MSITSSFDAKEQIRQAIDIVDLAGQYLQLRREGRIYKALCPWHDDTRPSLQINPERQSFKCWVCNIGGDIFSFVMKIENVEFREALTMLAERAGVRVQGSRFRVQGGNAGWAGLSGERAESPEHATTTDDANDKRTLYRAVAWAEEQYHHCLVESSEAEGARRYLDERGISEETIARYKLGFAPPAWDWLLGRARVVGFGDKALERAGLCKPRPNGPGYYDYFRGRVLFPIRDPQSRPVAFGARILPEFAEQNPAKYINSPETPLFSKSKLLYGLDTAREVIGKTQRALVMEGYTDVLIARQFGVTNAVAVLGTALGERHIQLLRRHAADRITLVLDGDEAGQKRTNEILELFIAQQVDLRIATLPDNLDPCDFLLARGAEEFNSLVASAKDALEHAFGVATRGLDVRRQPHDANRALDRMLQTIAKGPRLSVNTSSDHLIREATMLGRLARMFEVQEELLRQRIGQLRRGSATGGRPKLRGDNFVEVEPHTLSAWERELLELVLLEPESVPMLAEEIRAESLTAEHLRLVYAKCCELAAIGITPDFDRLMIEFDDERIKSLLVDVEEQARLKSAGLGAPARLRDLLAWHRRKHTESTVQSHARALRDEKLSDDDALRMLQDVLQQERSIRGIAVPTESHGLEDE